MSSQLLKARHDLELLSKNQKNGGKRPQRKSRG
jgi:hypothetical protein